MRGKKVKLIAQRVYGKSTRGARSYKPVNNQGTIMNTGLRLLYQEAKKYWKEHKSLPFEPKGE